MLLWELSAVDLAGLLLGAGEKMSWTPWESANRHLISVKLLFLAQFLARSLHLLCSFSGLLLIKPLNLISFIICGWHSVPIIVCRHLHLDLLLLLRIQPRFRTFCLRFPFTRLNCIPDDSSYILLLGLTVEWALKLIGVVFIAVPIDNSTLGNTRIIIVLWPLQCISKCFSYLIICSLPWQVLVRLMPWVLTCRWHILISSSILGALLLGIHIFLQSPVITWSHQLILGYHGWFGILDPRLHLSLMMSGIWCSSVWCLYRSRLEQMLNLIELFHLHDYLITFINLVFHLFNRCLLLLLSLRIIVFFSSFNWLHSILLCLIKPTRRTHLVIIIRFPAKAKVSFMLTLFASLWLYPFLWYPWFLIAYLQGKLIFLRAIFLNINVLFFKGFAGYVCYQPFVLLFADGSSDFLGCCFSLLVVIVGVLAGASLLEEIGQKWNVLLGLIMAWSSQRTHVGWWSISSCCFMVAQV